MKPNARSLPIPTRLGSAISHGIVASVFGGATLATFQPWLRQLLTDQPEPFLSAALYLFVCIQIGATVSLTIALQNIDRD